MWHVSIGGVHERVRRGRALQVLAGVGDATLGEWWEHAAIASHLRRRLSEPEARAVGPVIDVRGSAEGRSRVEAMGLWLPPAMLEEV